MKKMAKIVDQQNKNDVNYKKMAPSYDGIAFKAACELAIESFRTSFCGEKSYQKVDLFIASARAGNIIGGGDWSDSRGGH